MYDYRLGIYKYSIGTRMIYKKYLFFFYKRLNNHTYNTYLEGVKAVNKLADAE